MSDKLELAYRALRAGILDKTISVQQIVKATVIGACSMEMDVRAGSADPEKVETLHAIYNDFGPDFERAVKEFVASGELH